MPDTDINISASLFQPRPKKRRTPRDPARDKGRERGGKNRNPPRRDPSKFKDASANQLFFEPFTPRKIAKVYARAAVLAAIRASGGKIELAKLQAMLRGAP